ncbi:hypothetical protein D3C86_2056140 [compost metagenome]
MLDELVTPRPLELGQAGADAVGIQFAFADLGTQLDEGGDGLAPLFVRQTDHHHFLDGGVQ